MNFWWREICSNYLLRNLVEAPRLKGCLISHLNKCWVFIKIGGGGVGWKLVQSECIINAVASSDYYDTLKLVIFYKLEILLLLNQYILELDHVSIVTGDYKIQYFNNFEIFFFGIYQ